MIWVNVSWRQICWIMWWSFGLFLQLSLSKTGEVWWSAVLKGEAEIDVNQINRERTMGTVDEEEHAVLDRLSFDYQQKLQGKPQSHEIVSMQRKLLFSILLHNCSGT